jgi:cysteine desulfurase
MYGPAPVYRDYNATTPVDPSGGGRGDGAVRDRAVLPPLLRLRGGPGGPGGGEAARSAVAALIGADPEGVVGTSGGTERDN